ncbi:hypothetical protein, partial [Vibrio sp. B181a]|uniref:hypothetical protein n=1 Tax=Vibrio sp. B181a TaxID=2835906 RepID=UPI0025548A04
MKWSAYVLAIFVSTYSFCFTILFSLLASRFSLLASRFSLLASRFSLPYTTLIMSIICLDLRLSNL